MLQDQMPFGLHNITSSPLHLTVFDFPKLSVPVENYYRNASCATYLIISEDIIRPVVSA